MPLAMDRVVRKTLQGIAEAHRDYHSWTDGRWLWEAPEYLLTTYIAKKISSITDEGFLLTLENNVSSAIQDAGGLSRGRPQAALRPKGRYDILLWWANGTPRAVIEVKNQISGFAAIQSDAEKICAVLSLENTFRTGLVAFYTSNRDSKCGAQQARISMKRRLEDIERSARAFVRERQMTTRFHSRRITVDDDVDSAWVAAALQIQRP